MKRIRPTLYGALASILLSVGCSAQTAVKEETHPTNELVQHDMALEQPPEPVREPVLGSLNKLDACVTLTPEGPLFAQQQAQNAWLSFSSGNFKEAAEGFKKALEDKTLNDVDKQRVNFLAALALSKTGDPNDLNRAVDYMKTAFGTQANLSRTAAVYGTQMSFNASRWKDTLEFADTLLSLDDYRTYRAIALTNLGQYDAAVVEFDRLKEFPKSLRLTALQARAVAQDETSQHKAALETYRRIYELDPKSPQGQLAQEAIMAQKDTWPKGFVFPRATAKPDKSKSEREQAEAHFNAHRSESAISAYSKLLKADKARKSTKDVCDDLYAIARSHVKLRQHSKSMPFFTEALNTCKNTDLHVKILYTGAKAAWNAGQNETAIKWYQQIVDDYATHSYADDAYNYQALILNGAGKIDEAREVLYKQIEAYPDGDMAKDAYWALLQDLYERNLYKEAIEFVDKHIEHAGENDLYSQGRLRYFQGRAYEQLDDKQNAIKDYLKILEEYPLSYYAMLALGRLESVSSQKADEWIKTYRNRVYAPENAQDYCFTALSTDPRFDAARSLVQMNLYDDALVELQPMLDDANKRVAYEAKLARAMVLQKQEKHSDSARLAAALLAPQTDLTDMAYAAWLLAYPMPWHDLVSSAASNKTDDLFYTTYAIMREESYYNPKAESWANARGLMQIMLPTAQSTAAEIGLSKPAAKDLFVPDTAIPIGSAYIAKLMKILVPHPMFVLPGYNAGQGNVGKWMVKYADTDVDIYVEKIPFKEARHYAKRVGTTLWRYRWLYDEQMPKLFDPAKKVGDLGSPKE